MATSPGTDTEPALTLTPPDPVPAVSSERAAGLVPVDPGTRSELEKRVDAFVDQLLEAGGKDPVEGRLALLGDNARHIGVLKRVAEMADWGAAPPQGRQRGVAVHKSFNTYVAEIAEVSVGEDGAPFDVVIPEFALLAPVEARGG